MVNVGSGCDSGRISAYNGSTAAYAAAAFTCIGRNVIADGNIHPLCGEGSHITRDSIARRVGLAVAVLPTAKLRSIGGSQTVAAGGGKVLTGFHYQIDCACGSANASVAQLNRHHLQLVKIQRVRDFKNGAETYIIMVIV